MIDHILKAIAADLNHFFKLSLGTNDSIVTISNLINQNGQIPPNLSNKLICSLINIEQEKLRELTINKPSQNILKNPPVGLNLYLLFTSNFEAENYMQGLNYLSRLVSFLYDKSVLTPQNNPNLPSNVLKVTFEFANVNATELNKIWGALGAKYMPSAIYKIRVIMSDNNLLKDDGSNSQTYIKGPSR